MDTLTHALSGALVARATAPSIAGERDLALRTRVAAGAVAAAFPDIDFVLGFVSPVVYLETHRGVTHSILLLPLWALLLAFAASRLARDGRGWAPWFGVCALGIATHIAGDLITGFGTMILAPVSSARFGLGATFIIDLWFTGLIVAGLLASVAWPRTRVPAVAATAALAGYVALQAGLKAEAERFGVEYAAAQGFDRARVEAHARPVSPFNWTVFVMHGDDIAYSHVNLRRERPNPAPGPDAGLVERLDAAYRPLRDARWEHRTRFGPTPQQQALARSAWNAHAFAFFRWFADVPAFDGLTAGSECVWFRDLRFEMPGREATPFRFAVCRDGPDDPWRLATQDAGRAGAGAVRR
ncbi:MAG TPA: metal-dependent hydrolase [Casimicrobiaceae bacterium]|nr:metal-dependent hydrolase [Casimicrobiaceae bacterium]